jgi:ERCC4-type nuclease
VATMRIPKPKPCIWIDRREQERHGSQYVFDDSVDTERVTLQTGGYTIKDRAGDWIIERKALGDFVGCCVGESRERFFRELDRMLAIPFRRVAIEATIEDVGLGHYYATGVHPNSVMGTAWAIEAMGIGVIWGGDREHTQIAVQAILTKLWAHAEKEKCAAARVHVLERPDTGE